MRLAVVASLVVLAALCALPLVAGTFRIEQATRILIYAIFAMSLDLLVGYAGLVSLGHAAFFGIAAYAGAMLAERAGIDNALVALPLSVAAAAVAAALVGLLTIRLRRISFIMVTLAVAQIVFFLFNDNAIFGGSDGILAFSAKPYLGLAGWRLLDLGDVTTRYLFTLALAALVFAGLLLLTRSPFGRVIQGIRSNERRMRALGYRISAYRLVAFTIGSTLAGLAGYLYFLLTTFVDPTLTYWLHSAQLLVMVLLGGMGTLVGPVLGAAIVTLFVDGASEVTEHWRLGLGVIVVTVGLASRGGVWKLATGLLPRRRARTLAPNPAER